MDGPTHAAMRKASVVKHIDGAIIYDGFEAALVGFGYQFNYPVAVYDKERCLEILTERDGMSWEEAVEYFEFNVSGAWVGESTPVFLETEDD